MPKISNGFKNSLFPMETNFTQFINNFLKIEEMEYLIHHVNVEMWPALCKLPILFTTVKFKFGHHFSQFIYRFKIGSFKSWAYVVLPSFSQFTKKLKIVIFESCSSWNRSFSPILGRD